jgi:hypothetical protein
VRRYANPAKGAPSSKVSDDGSDKMDEDARQGQAAGAEGAEEEDSDEGFLSTSEEEA